MIPDYHFGEMLKEYLDKKGIKQAHIAKKIGVSTAAFNDYFKAQNPRKSTKTKILDGLGITLEILHNEGKEAIKASERENALLKEIDELRSELMIYHRKEIKELNQKVLIGAVQP